MSEQRIPFLPEESFHIYNHATGWDFLFQKRENYFYFLEKYAARVLPVVKTYAYCLLPNHFHFLVKVRSKKELAIFFAQKKEMPLEEVLAPEFYSNIDFDEIVYQQMSNFLNGYSQAFNKFVNRKGRLLRSNTKKKLVGNPTYFSNVVHYLHYNAVYHGLVDKPEDWAHSSYHAYMCAKETKLDRTTVLGWFGGIELFKEQHQNKPDWGMSDILEG